MKVVVGLVAVLASLLIIEPTPVTASLKYKDCGSQLGKIVDLEISGCTALPCPLKKGTNVTVTMKFSAEANIAKAVTRVYGYIYGAKLPFPLPNDNACDFMKCPVSTGTDDTYVMDLEVKHIYPAMELIVQWELHNNTKDGTMITCFEVQAQIL